MFALHLRHQSSHIGTSVGVKVAETSRIQGRAQERSKRLSVHRPTKSTFYYTQAATYKMGLAGQKKYISSRKPPRTTGN
jgi:hypothetical protein